LANAGQGCVFIPLSCQPIMKGIVARVTTMSVSGCKLALTPCHAASRRASNILSVIVALLCLMGALGESSAADSRSRTVLIIDESDPSSGAPTTFSTTLRATLGSFTPHIALYGETLDLSRFSVARQETILRTYLQEKYSDVRFGVIAAVGSSALEIVRRWRSELWPGVPVVFAAIDEISASQLKLDPDMTGLVMRRSIRSMMTAARILVPDLKGVAVLGGSLERDAYRRQYLRELPILASEIELMNLTGLPLSEQVMRAATLPSNTAILYTSLFVDDAGTRYSSPDALAEIAKHADGPIVVDVEALIGAGATGGYVLDNVSYGKEVASLALRILDGTEPAAIAVEVSNSTRLVFDWRQLVRWRISATALPPYSEIRFRSSAPWDQYRWQIVAFAAAFLGQSLLISHVLIQRYRRRRAEASLAESEERMSFTAASMNIGMWQFDRATNELWATEHCRALFGLPGGVPLSRDTILNAIHPEDREITVTSLREAANSGGRVELSDFRVPLADGRVRWIRSRVRSHLDGQRGSADLTGIFVDVTEQLATEAETDLQRREIAHLNRVSALGELSGAIAHEINQPLTAILSNAQAALHLLSQQTPDLDEVRDVLADIVQEDIRAGEVIHRLRRLLKKGGEKVEQLNVNDLIQSTLALLHSEMIGRGVTVETDLAHWLPPVPGDPVQLQQVLLNLILNAMDAMAMVPIKHRVVAISTHISAIGAAEIAVKDHGSGIRPEDQSKVFSPFYSTKDQGLGLGLTICSTIVSAHGGSLTLENHEAGGARAMISLPVQHFAAAAK
jgi:PAS domain S-box-containing protein